MRANRSNHHAPAGSALYQLDGISAVGDNAISNHVKFGNRRTTSSLAHVTALRKPIMCHGFV